LNLLLDTHVALWAIGTPGRLPRDIRDLIADPGNEVFVSAASLWEIAIKHALARGGLGAMPLSAEAALAYFGEAGYALLSVSARHVVAVEGLPRLHGDPFDRLLVAQALEEPLRLITHDATVAAYGETIICF
jgi:PIN domain nuclease of toxin-antitoxin system